MADLDRIKRNVSKMVEMNAPESDIDGYIVSEGVTLEQVRNHKLNTQEPQPIIVPELRDKEGNVVTKENVEYVPEKNIEGKVSKLNPLGFTKSLGKGFVHGVSSLGKGLGKNVVNPLRTKIGKQPLTDYEIENMYGSFLGLPEEGGAYKTGKVVGEIAPYMILPEAKVAQLGTVGNAALTGAYQGALGSGLSSIAEKGLDPKENLKDIAIGTATGGLIGGAIGKGGQIIARNQRAKDIAKRRATPLSERMTQEQLERVTNPEIKPSQYGVAEDNTEVNNLLADVMKYDIQQEEKLLRDYKNIRSEMMKKYGSAEELKAQAYKDLQNEVDYGIVSDALKDYRYLLDLEKKLQGAKYVSTNIKPISTREGVIVDNISKPTKQQPIQEVTTQVAQQADDVVPEQVVQAVPEQTLPNGKMKKSTLAQKAEKSPEVAKSVEENPPMYHTITNAETTAQAQREIAENIDKVQTDILKKLTDEEAEVTALDVEKSRQLFTELQKQGRYDDAIDLLERTSKQGSKLGQAVQAFSLWSKTTPEGAMLYAQKLLDKYNKGVRKKLQKHISEEDLNKIGKKFEELEQSGLTGRELEVATAKAMKEVYKVVPKTFAQKLESYRYINMLLSGKSRVKDFLLTGKNALDIAIDEAIAGGIIDPARRFLTKDNTRYVSANPFVGAKNWFSGAKKGFKEGVEDVRYDINTSRSGEVGRYGLPTTATFEAQALEGNLAQKALTAVKNTPAYAEKLLRYSMQVPDRMFFEARFASSLANQMKARGVSEPTQDMLNNALKEAKRAVYQEDRPITKAMTKGAEYLDIPSNIVEQAFGLPQNTLPSVSKGLVPFVKTPTNVIAQGAEGLHGSVSGYAKLKKAIENGDAEAIREAELLMGRGIRGLGELVLGYNIGKNIWDNIKTNIGEKDYYANEITGLKPNSIVLGDKAFSMQNMQTNLPIITGIGLGQSGLGKAYINTADVIAEMPALKALGDLNKINKEVNYLAKTDDADEELLKKGDRMLRSLGANYITSLIPLGGALGELRNDIDPNARELYVPVGDTDKEIINNSLKYLGNRVVNRLPFASKSLPQKYNALGQPIKSNNIDNGFARALSEFIDFGIRNYNEPPPEMAEMQRLQDYAMENNVKGKTTLKFAKPKRYIGRGKDKTRLTNEQYSELTRLYNGRVYDELQFLMNTPEYKSADEETKIKWVKEVFKEKKDEAEQELFGIINKRGK